MFLRNNFSVHSPCYSLDISSTVEARGWGLRGIGGGGGGGFLIPMVLQHSDDDVSGNGPTAAAPRPFGRGVEVLPEGDAVAAAPRREVHHHAGLSGLNPHPRLRRGKDGTASARGCGVGEMG